MVTLFLFCFMCFTLMNCQHYHHDHYNLSESENGIDHPPSSNGHNEGDQRKFD
jgi:hypothetical protein